LLEVIRSMLDDMDRPGGPPPGGPPGGGVHPPGAEPPVAGDAGRGSAGTRYQPIPVTVEE